MLVLIRVRNGWLHAVDANRITSIETKKASDGHNFISVYFEERGNLAQFDTAEPIENLVRRINEVWMDHAPELPPEAGLE